MAIEEPRLRVRRSLEEKLGVEEASYLMDRPPGGWSELVTNHTLDLKFQVIEQRFRGVDHRFVSIDERFRQIDDRLDRIDDRLDRIDDRLTLLGERVDATNTGIHELRTDLAGLEGRLAWKLITAVIGGMAVMGALFAGITSIAGG